MSDLPDAPAIPILKPDTTTGFTVDPATFSDLRSVAAIQRQSFRRGLAYGYFQLMLLWMLPNVTFLVARTSFGIVAGCLIADRYRGDVRVVNLAIDPSFRRQGVGRRLLREIQQRIPDGHVTLIVEEFNEVAQSLYKSEGFMETGTARNYYGRGRNGIWMRKERMGGSTVGKIFA